MKPTVMWSIIGSLSECFPVGLPTCYINLGEPYQLVVGKNRYQIEKSTDVLILRNSIVERHNLPTDHIFTIKFFPGGLEAILGINQVRLVDQVVRLETIFPATLIQRIRQLSNFDERVELLEPFLLGKLRGQKKADHYQTIVADTIRTYGATGMELTTSQLAERMFSTSKTINRYFHRIIGTPPKNYFNTLRARKALSGYIANKNHFSPDDYGYYDMSHFYKSVVKFSGRKLGENSD